MAIQRQFPRILQAAFSKKKPKEAPPIPSYDEYMQKYYNKDIGGKHTIYDEASEEDTFVDYIWWKQGSKDDAPVAEYVEETFGGNQVFSKERVVRATDSQEELEEAKLLAEEESEMLDWLNETAIGDEDIL